MSKHTRILSRFTLHSSLFTLHSSLFTFHILLFTFISTIAQENPASHKNTAGIDQQYESYKKIFENELVLLDQENRTTEKKTPVIRSSIPEWLFSIPAGNETSIYTIGISDPGMPGETGFNLAFLRARAMISLFSNTTIEHLTDYYTVDESGHDKQEFNSKYSEFYRLSGMLLIDTSCLKILKKAVTDHGEIIVLVEYSKKDPYGSYTDSLQFFAESLIVEFQKNDGFEINSRSELIIKDNYFNASGLDESKYVNLTINKLNEITSTYNNMEIPGSDQCLKYIADHPIQDVDKENNGGVKLTYGLWNAYFVAILKNIYLAVKSTGTSLRNMGDYYTRKTQNLNREASRIDMSFEIEELYIINNELKLKLKYL